MKLSNTFLSLVTLALAVGGGFAAPSTKIHGSVVIPPRGWARRGVPHPDHTIVLRIGLAQPNFSVLEKHLHEVSDPDHARYGAYLSNEEVEELTAPHPDSLHAVDEWLASHEVAENSFTRSPAKDWVKLTVPIRVAEKLLETKYYIWVHEESGEQIVRTTSYRLPGHLHEHIEVVQPTTIFARTHGMRSTISWPASSASLPLEEVGKLIDTPYGLVDASCDSTITINCLQQLYQTEGYTPNYHHNSIAATGYLEEWANFDDLKAFYEDQLPQAVNSTFDVVLINGGLNNQTKPGAEANLDVQFAFGMAYPIPGTYYSTGGRPPFNASVHTPTNTNEPYQDWLEYVLKQEHPPRVITTSYGDDEQTVPREYAKRLCQGFAGLGAKGITLLFSSGDYGVGDGNSDPNTQKCFTNDGLNATRFIPSFPASCPFVTAVGGTEFINPEVAVSRYYSGGGFSNYFNRPDWQDGDVEAYLASDVPGDKYKDLFNRKGRAYPDVAAQGDRYRVFLSGKATAIGGTSASSPAFAGVVALLNDARLQAGQPVLGFMNPWLYKVGRQGLNDIISGKNPGCGTEGFNAVEGWDPVTGLGTPNFRKLKALPC